MGALGVCAVSMRHPSGVFDTKSRRGFMGDADRAFFGGEDGVAEGGVEERPRFVSTPINTDITSF